MALKRGRDEKDFIKDIHDRARNIVAQGKEVPRIRSYNLVSGTIGFTGDRFGEKGGHPAFEGLEYPHTPSGKLTDSSIPVQYPSARHMGMNQNDLVLHSRNQSRRIADSSPFYKEEVPFNSRDNNTYGSSLFFNDKMMFNNRLFAPTL